MQTETASKEDFFVPAIALTVIDGEPRARDVDIAERLGFAHPRQIRELIKRNLAEIEDLGPASCRTTLLSRPQGGTVEIQEYWFTEEQALLVSVLSKAPNAPAVRAMLIKIFVAWRRGHLSGASHSVSEIVALAVEAIRRHDEARERAIEERVVARISEGAFIFNGMTPGEIWRECGFPPIKGIAVWFGNRLERAGCSIAGRKGHGTSRARAFNFDHARGWMNNGGRFLIEQKIAERRGQGKLHLVGKAE